jgi:membrane dipeptidase
MRNSDVSATVAPASYDFGLTEAQEARAGRLHRESIVIDLLPQHAGGDIFAHYPPELQKEFAATIDAAGGGFRGFRAAEYWPYEMSMQGKSDLIFEWFKESGLTCGTYDVPVGSDPDFDDLPDLTRRYAQLPWLRYVTRAEEIRQAKREGVIAFFGNWQPVFTARRDLALLDDAYARGLRSFMLTYNQMDNIGVGCTERVDAGLSAYGVKVVKHCNDLGIIVDVSHCGPLTTLDACRHSKKPVTANHTCVRHLSGHARGKTDEALRAIADTGGVIGIVTLPIFLTRESHATIDHMLDHMEYIAHLVGWRHVAIGTDHPLQAPNWLQKKIFASVLAGLGFRPEDRLDTTKLLVGYENCRDLPNITRGLVKRGFSDEQIRGILGENALRVFTEICGN